MRALTVFPRAADPARLGLVSRRVAIDRRRHAFEERQNDIETVLLF